MELSSFAGGFVESRRVDVYVLMWDCYRPAIDHIVDYEEKY